MTINLCSQEGCEREVSVIKRGLCNPHFQSWARKNKPNGKKPCLFEGCENHHYAKGYCNKHYARSVNGSLALVKREPVFCERHPEREAACKGMCRSCYQLWYYHNGPTGTGPARQRRDDIGYEGAHLRIKADRGHAHQQECSLNADGCLGQAKEWALKADAPGLRYTDRGRMIGTPYSVDPMDYVPMCVPCHRWYDSKDGGGPKKIPAKNGEGPRYEEYLKYKEKKAS